MPQLYCEDLNLGYDGKTVVCGLSFSVNAGDYLCVVGENGAGKSTLVKTVLKLRAPLSGRICVEGGLRFKEIGYLPQQTAAQKDFPASVREIILSGCLGRCGLRPFYGKAEKRIAEHNMERLGIAHLAGHCYRELSGGQQKRVLLARALCAAEKMLLLDEPAAGLDSQAAEDMYALVQKLNQSGMTVIMVSHDLAAAEKYASHILHIGASSTLFFGKAEEYFAKEAGMCLQRTGGET